MTYLTDQIFLNNHAEFVAISNEISGANFSLAYSNLLVTLLMLIVCLSFQETFTEDPFSSFGATATSGN